MKIHGGSRRFLASAGALALLGLAACGPGRGSPGAGGTVAPDWHVYPDVFAVNGPPAGPLVMLPRSGGCFTAFGQDSTGYGTVDASWTATGDCTTSTATAPTGPGGSGDGLPSGDGVALVAASPAHGGGYLVLSRRTFYGDAGGYEVTVSIGTPGKDLRVVGGFLAQSRGSHIGPDSVVTTAHGYVAAGYVEQAPTVWTSADGVTWHGTALPAGPQMLNLVDGLHIAAGQGGNLVVVGWHQTDGRSDFLDGWHSGDGGRTWSRSSMPELPGLPQVHAVVYDGHGYVAVGTTDWESGAPALVLRSPDGVTWTRDTSIDASGALGLHAVTVLPGGSVLAVAPTGTRGPEAKPGNGEPPLDSDTTCAAAWIATAGSWVREDIGCHGVPDALAVLGDGSVVGARGGYLFLRVTPDS